MRKIILLLVLSTLLLSGCTAVRIETNSIDNITKILLSKPNNLFNRVGKGYAYYIPRGVTYIDTADFNDKLYCNGEYYYMYVDAVSYYYGIKKKYNAPKEFYYSKTISNNDKEGYLEIIYREKINKYHIKFVYNYAKIEALVEKNNINEVVMNASYILSTVKFNDNVIKLAIGENYYKEVEENFNIFETKKKTNDYQLKTEEETDNEGSE